MTPDRARPADAPPTDLGFGSVVARQSRLRLLNRDGSFNVVREGLGVFERVSPYHVALTMRWPGFLAAAGLLIVALNMLFAGAYLLCGHDAFALTAPIRVTHPFLLAFFFSVETFATIGYGHIVPVTAAAHWVMVLESLVGLLVVALVTGLIFARFARPTARIRFSRGAVIAPYRGGTGFMFRIVNARSSQLIEVQCNLLLSRLERDANGTLVRGFHQLALERDRVAFFPLAWTVVHPIDRASPLWGETPESLQVAEAEFLILLTGTDESFAAVVHSRTSYRAEEIEWDRRFADLFNPMTADGVMSIDIDRLDATEAVAGV